MPIILTCRNCGRPFRASERHAGLEVGCPRCHTAVVVPNLGATGDSAGGREDDGRQRDGRTRRVAISGLSLILLLAVVVTGYLLREGRLTFRAVPGAAGASGSAGAPGLDPGDLPRTEQWLNDRLTQLDELRRHQNALRYREAARALQAEVEPWLGKRVTWEFAVQRVDEQNVYLEARFDRLRLTTGRSPSPSMIALPIGKAISHREARALAQHDRLKVTAELGKLEVDGKPTASDDAGSRSRVVVQLSNPRTAEHAAFDDLMRAGEAALASKDHDRAVASFEAALRMVGNERDSPESRRARESLAAAEASRQTFQTVQSHLDAGRKAIQSRFFDTAEREFAAAQALVPDDPEPKRLVREAKLLGLFEKEEIALRNGDFDAATDHVNRALALAPEDPRTKEARTKVRDAHFAAGMKEGRAAMDAGNFAKAVEHFRRAEKARPTDAKVVDLRQEAVKLQSETRYREGIEAAEKGIARFRYGDAQIAVLDALAAKPHDPAAAKLAADIETATKHGEIGRYKTRGRVLALNFDDDGKSVLCVNDDGTLSRLTIDTPESNVVGKGLPGERLEAAAFAGNRKSVALGNREGGLRHYSVIAPGLEPKVVKGQEGGIRSVAVSSNGLLLATGHERWAVELWDAERDRQVGQISTYNGRKAVTAIAFAPDGESLVTGHETGSVVQWAMADPHRKIAEAGAPKQAHSTEVTSLSFSPDGRDLATASRDATIKLWDTRDLSLNQNLKVPGPATFVVFSTTGKHLAAGGEDGSIRVWDTGTRRPRESQAAIPGHQAAITALAFAPDESVLGTASADGMVKLWSLAGKGPTVPQRPDS